jgi:hypothetical protein
VALAILGMVTRVNLGHELVSIVTVQMLEGEWRQVPFVIVRRAIVRLAQIDVSSSDIFA